MLKISTQLLPVLCWAVDNRLFYAYRDNPASEREDSGIWWVRVNQKSGELEGKPVQLTKGAGRIGGLSVSADGRRLIFWRANSSPQVFLAEIDAESGRFKTPRRLSLDDSTNQVYAWTPDSRAVLFSSNRSGTTKLYRQAIDQAVPEVLVEGRGMFLARAESRRHADPVCGRIQRSGSCAPATHIERSTTGRHPAGGPAKAVHRQHPMRTESVETLPLHTLEGSTAHFFTFDPEDGKTQEFATLKVKGGLNWSLSRDGSQLALILQPLGHSVTFMAVSDKTTHEVELNPMASPEHRLGCRWQKRIRIKPDSKRSARDVGRGAQRQPSSAAAGRQRYPVLVGRSVA